MHQKQTLFKSQGTGNLLPPLDSLDLAILKAISNKPDITTREIEGVIYLSRTQVLRRLQQLQEQNLVIKKNGVPGQTYRYKLSLDVTLSEIERANTERLNNSRDPVTREALEVLLQGIRVMSDQLAELARSDREHSEVNKAELYYNRIV